MPEPRQRLLFTDEIVGFEKDLIHLHDGSVRAVVATSSLNFNAMAPWVAAPPARNAAAISELSVTSSREAPAVFAPFV